MILIVDDNADLGETCAMLLRACGYEVMVALCGDSAMEIMQTRLPHLLISDCCMPGMTGLQLCDYLHKVHHIVPFPILLMSASPRRLAAPGEGYDAFIQKPFLASALLTQVRQMAGAPRALPLEMLVDVH